MKSLYNKILALLLLATGFTAVSCFNDLNTEPIDPNVVTSANVYDQPGAYKQVLAKVYAGLSLSGQQGPSGQPDITGIDEGFSTYLRQYWKAQELTTDEAVIAWNDGNIHDYHQQDWDANNEFVTAMYNRIFYQITLCNEYIRETSEDKLDSRGVNSALRADIAVYRAEARFLRALSYYHALDMFRQVPFVTEEDAVGSFFPEQATADQLFEYIETECKAIESQLLPARTNEYGRADQAAVWMLLAKMYLNAEVYTGRQYYTDCITYTKKVIDAGYSLEPDYQHLFTADNDQAEGIIFPVTFDGLNSQTFGGNTFIVHAGVGGNMVASDYGIDGGWGGTRVTSALVDKFPATGGSVIVAPNDGQTYPAIYLPGDYQGWDPATASTLASVNSDNQYEGYLYFASDNSPFKITPGPNWDNNLGDDGGDGTLEPNGSDIVVAEAGFYRIKVDLDNNTYTLEKTTWGLIGSATPDEWNSDQDMTYNATEGAWEITLDLVAGVVKFRANDLWDINYGDSGADAILEEGGDDISIPADGTYLIRLYLDKPDYTYSIENPIFDSRAIFYSDGQELEISDISLFTDGYAAPKFTNVTSEGVAGSHPTYVDTDFPLFRLADAYLMYVEAVLRGGSGGDLGDATNYINLLRERAYNGTAGNIEQADLSLDFILDERAREFYWECTRRTDLIRFGQFSDGTYLWPWKGGVKDGITRPSFYNVFPIPSSDIGANPNLQQNPGY